MISHYSTDWHLVAVTHAKKCHNALEKAVKKIANKRTWILKLQYLRFSSNQTLFFQEMKAMEMKHACKSPTVVSELYKVTADANPTFLTPAASH